MENPYPSAVVEDLESHCETKEKVEIDPSKNYKTWWERREEANVLKASQEEVVKDCLKSKDIKEVGSKLA